MLETSGGEVIADEDISVKSGVQNFCIEHHDVEFWITSINVIENFN